MRVNTLVIVGGLVFELATFCFVCCETSSIHRSSVADPEGDPRVVLR